MDIATSYQAPALAEPEETGREFDAPEREAAFFYGLFMRGYSYQELRRDIEVPPEIMKKWELVSSRDPGFASMTDRMLGYRRRVLAIFMALVAHQGESIH